MVELFVSYFSSYGLIVIGRATRRTETRVHRISPFQRIERTTPPSTRNAAPLVAEESGLATNATRAATSSVVAKRCKSFDDRRPFCVGDLFKGLELINAQIVHQNIHVGITFCGFRCVVGFGQIHREGFELR